MNGRDDHDCRHFIGVIFPHLVLNADHAIANSQQGRADRDRVARKQLLFIADVLLDARDRAAMRAQIFTGQAGHTQKISRALVEFADIPHHIHMAHVVTMPWINCSTIGQHRLCHDLVSSAASALGEIAGCRCLECRSLQRGFSRALSMLRAIDWASLTQKARRSRPREECALRKQAPFV